MTPSSKLAEAVALATCWGAPERLLAGVEFGEGLVVEVAEATGEVTVGLQAGVVPGGARIRSRGSRPPTEHQGVVGDLVAFAVGRDRGRGSQPG
jgi:hypothetical protein